MASSVAVAPRYKFHLIANSHLDPVWLWDWREGVNEGLITVRTILKLMEEFPELTYIRGETSIYEHLERFDPESFAKVREHIAAGRWDYLGATYVQADTNLTGTETMVRQYAYGQQYFRSRFGKPSLVGWAADSFGHSAGLPTILNQAGIRYYAFFRPSEALMHLDGPAFRWQGADGAEVLSYRPFMGWYANERDGMNLRLDESLEDAGKYPFRNVAVFYGLGNHGGGPSRRHILDIQEWSRNHPEVEVVHSGLHRFFAEIEEEIKGGIAIPEVKGELNFWHRGIYASAARLKFQYRKAEAGLLRAETTTAAIEAGLSLKPTMMPETWRGLLFNSFHDILPGTAMERAIHEQISWIEGISHQGLKTEFESLNLLAQQINVPAKSVPGDHPEPVTFLVWNPHPYVYEGPLEIEAALDYRPIFAYEKSEQEIPLEVRDVEGKSVPFQAIETEHHFMASLPWRRRVVLDAQIPALGWTTYSVGWVEDPEVVPATEPFAAAPEAGRITGGRYSLRAEIGATGIQIAVDGQELFSGEGLGLQTLEDPWGAWGNHYGVEREADDISTVLETWKVTECKAIETGPLRSSLWVRMADSASRADFIFQIHHDRRAIEVQTRVFWDRPACRLKLVMPGVGPEAEYEILGGVIRRGAMTEVPGGRWVRILGGKQEFGFASDALYNFDLKGEDFRATIVRSSRYSSDVPDSPDTPMHWPVIDNGEYRFKFLLATDSASLPRWAAELERPAITLPIPPREGKLPMTGSFAQVENTNIHLLALKPSEDQKSWILRLQEIEGVDTIPSIQWLGASLQTEALPAFAIRTYRITAEGKDWLVKSVGLDEE